MKNRRGFTLVEMIFVIVVLCLVATASVSIFINIRKSILEKEYNNVVSYLETKAIEYANKTNITTINVEDLIDSVLQLEIRRQQDVPLTEYIDILNEHTREADDDEEKDEIQIMTIHSSKGLEFKAVFLPHFNDGSLPNAKSLLNKL